MQAQISDRNEPSSMLHDPDHILLFVKHVLGFATITPPEPKPPGGSKAGRALKMEDLRLVPEEDHIPGEDSDDEPDDTAVTIDGSMTETAINLLLSILEGLSSPSRTPCSYLTNLSTKANPSLSASTTPALNDIFDLLEPVAKNSSHPARPVAREALLVITARLASTSASGQPVSMPTRTDSSQEMYQKALKLVQDPILPIRAHGLLLLRQVITSPDADRSLVPAILSIFLQFIQDDDSYMFLNAVQGLAAMVDRFGQEVLKGLVDVYTRGLNGLGAGNLTQHEVDTRIRVGETLGQVIRRCGQTLGIYGNINFTFLATIVDIYNP